MSWWRRPLVLTAALLGLTVSAGSVRSADPAEAPSPRAVLLTPAQLRTQGELAEREGRWAEALDLYLRAFVGGQPSGDLRERIRVCLRNATQVRRQQDPAFQQFVLSLLPSDALHLYAEVVTQLGAKYFDRDRSTAARLFVLGLDELDRALGDPAFRQAHLDNPPEGKVQAFQRSLRDDRRVRLPANAAEARHAVREVIRDAQARLVVRNPSAFVFEFLCGACSGLDEYTVYLTPSGAQAELASPIVELANYGILIRYRGSDLLVDGVVPGSWAALHAGLRPGDRIVRVNGRPVETGGPAALARALQHPPMAGHEVELAYDGDMLPQAVRLPVPVPTVYGVDVVNPKDGVGYLRLAAFRESTPRELDDALMHLKARDVRAVIIDVRGNPGGLFTPAIHVAQRFLPAGIVVTTQGQSPEFADRVFSSDAGMGALDRLPVVLLVDTKTMSAAEAVAAAWKDHNRAVLIGLPTFGKGVVQAPVRLQAADSPDGPRSGMLVLSVATMFGPRGLAINGSGVMPHLLEPDPNRQLELAIAKAIELAGGMP